MVGEEQPDLVVLDWDMPDVDGLAALPDIRRAAPESMVVMMTDYADPALAAMALTAGADRVCPKTPSLAHHFTDDLKLLMSGRPGR